MEPGQEIGAYTLERKLGQGAHAEVWLAVHAGGALGFSRKVALKLVRPGKADDEAEIEAFLREAGLVANLSHPNIVDTFSVSEDGGRLHIAMEYVDGGSLHDLVNRCRRLGLALPNSVVCSVLVDICRGLAAAHEAEDADGNPLRVVHRDLKLGNILLCKTGVAKVADFGMAKAAGDMTATATGFVKGTPAYVAPEVWEGAREFTPSVDLFAVGCIAYSLVTRRRLFDGENVASIYGQIIKRKPDQEAAPIAEKYPGLAPVVEKLLQRDPAIRYRTAHETADDLAAVLRRTPAAGGPGDFLWLLNRVEALQSEVDDEEETHGAAPFKIPEQAEAGWAEAIRQATGRRVEVLPLEASGGSSPLKASARPGSSGPVVLGRETSAPPPAQAKTPGLRDTTLLPPRVSPGSRMKTSMDFDVVKAAGKPARRGGRRRRKKAVARRRKLQAAILVLLGVLAVVVGLVLARAAGSAAGDSAEVGVERSMNPPPDLPVARSAAGAPEESVPSEPASGTRGAETPVSVQTPADVLPPASVGERAVVDVITPSPAPSPTPSPTPPAAPEGVSDSPPTGCLVISASPRGAKVWLDGSPLVRSAGAGFGLALAPGQHTVSMGMVSTPSVEQSVTLASGAAVRVHCVLSGAGGCTTGSADPAMCD